MQTKITEREINHTWSGQFSKQIGSTVYTVNVYSKEGSTETLEDKVLRLIKRDLEFKTNHGKNLDNNLQTSEKDSIIGLPQADWLPERSIV